MSSTHPPRHTFTYEEFDAIVRYACDGSLSELARVLRGNSDIETKRTVGRLLSGKEKPLASDLRKLEDLLKKAQEERFRIISLGLPAPYRAPTPQEISFVIEHECGNHTVFAAELGINPKSLPQVGRWISGKEEPSKHFWPRFWDILWPMAQKKSRIKEISKIISQFSIEKLDLLEEKLKEEFPDRKEDN